MMADAMTDVFIAFGVVFVAELGDKTQLVVLTHGARHRRRAVLGALVVTIAVLQAISVTVGGVIGEALPERTTGILVGILFLGFAVWTWRTASREPTDSQIDARVDRRGAWSVAFAFFLAELGDKTMLTTASLAADRGIVPVYVGSFAAMVAAASLALLAGGWLSRRVQPATIARVGAVLFAVIGAATLATAL
jgi:putative Ca2+/H+ antiporter (TMEM165/GDT1 family)